MNHSDTDCCCENHSESQTKFGGRWLFSFGFVFLLVALSKPFMAEQLIRSADAYYCNGFYDEAIRQYEKAILFDESDSDIWVSLGNSLQAKREASKAVAAFKKAVSIAPYDRTANFNLGAALVISKDYRSAVVYLEKVRSMGAEPVEERQGGGFSYYMASLETLAKCLEKLQEFERAAIIRKELELSRCDKP